MSDEPLVAPLLAPLLALDIGGGHVTAGVVDGSSVGQLVRRSSSPAGTADELLDTWAGAATDAWSISSRIGGPIAIGIAMPAPFDYERGVARLEHKFAALYGIAVGAELAARWQGTVLAGVPVVFGNDADLWALGEASAGQGRGSDRVIGLTLGSGLGSGFIAQGRVVRTGSSVPPDGEIWNVAFADGIAEDRVSGRAVTEAYVRRTGRSLDAVDVAGAARAADRAAIEVFAALGDDLGAVIAPWARAFRADMIVVGGNVARAFDLFGPTLAHGLEGLSDVRCTVLFEKATLIGAAVVGRGAADAAR